ncbi:Pr6Pr family membrane protein [Lysobacter sp. 5GHs7-4]|uniref:Pr6Pr family membrane protein n=1 Tax=Lysobacter sp. 5GHs7-4 TaxID=2904253 RepID=UPI001E2B243A|nr:Pr6Pr family membrane protein [Lysobacter sp. 5GHs7-4]UHQ24494.1 Pr6Pr family membrane protein [Lysobacter sp. 5GHs7-4]
MPSSEARSTAAPEPAPAWSRALAALVAAVSLAALIGQYWLLIAATLHTEGPAAATLRYLSYFTILSNLLVSAVCVQAALGGGARLGRWLAGARVRGGVALAIGVTGTVYFVVLRHLWQPQGAQWWVDSGLHYATPALYLAWWLLAVPHGRLGGRDLWRWLWFPACYLVWTFLRGAAVQQYPYPFLDVLQLGWPTVLRNAGGVLALFLAFGAGLLGVDRLLGRRGRAG